MKPRAASTYGVASEARHVAAMAYAQEVSHPACIRMSQPRVGTPEADQDAEDDLAIVVVSYRYSTSSDRVLNRNATWKGRVLGRSLATVMSELRRLHCCATNIAITDIEWRDDPELDAGAPERSAGPGRLRDGGPCMATI